MCSIKHAPGPKIEVNYRGKTYVVDFFVPSIPAVSREVHRRAAGRRSASSYPKYLEEGPTYEAVVALASASIEKMASQ